MAFSYSSGVKVRPQHLEEKTSSLYALCHSRKLERRSSPLGPYDQLRIRNVSMQPSGRQFIRYHLLRDVSPARAPRTATFLAQRSAQPLLSRLLSAVIQRDVELQTRIVQPCPPACASRLFTASCRQLRYNLPSTLHTHVVLHQLSEDRCSRTSPAA